jgi:hypothetical protein
MRKTKKLNIDKLLKNSGLVDAFGPTTDWDYFEIETKPKHDNFPIYVLCAGMVVGMLLIWVLRSL